MDSRSEFDYGHSWMNWNVRIVTIPVRIELEFSFQIFPILIKYHLSPHIVVYWYGNGKRIICLDGSAGQMTVKRVLSALINCYSRLVTCMDSRELLLQLLDLFLFYLSSDLFR